MLFNLAFQMKCKYRVVIPETVLHFGTKRTIFLKRFTVATRYSFKNSVLVLNTLKNSSQF